MRPSRLIAVGLALLVVAGAVVFVVVKSSLGTPPSAPPSGSTFSGIERPFGPTAPWNVPVAGLALASRSDEWRDRFWYYSRANTDPAHPNRDPHLADHGVMFGLDADPSTDFSVAVYNARDATTMMKVRHRANWNGAWNFGPDQTIPWNPGWHASSGSDGLILILDPDHGVVEGLWGVVQKDANGNFNDSECWSHKLDGTGYDRSTDLCAGGALVSSNSTGQPVDYRTYTGNEPVARGSGIPALAMVTFPEEVAQGAIRHALMMPVYNTMGGPTCGADVTSESDPRFGTTCGRAVAPAGSLENPTKDATSCGPDADNGITQDQRRKQAVPEGTRYALRLTDADIDTWLDSRHYTGELRRTARIFAVALRDYGWFITDTTCYAAEFQVAGGANPATATAWRHLGIAGDGRSLLYGLMTRQRIVTIEPATNHCANGTTSQFNCQADTTGYG
jgi:hypothetical protein